MEEEIVIPILFIGGTLVLIAFNIAFKTVSKTICHWRDNSLKIRLVEAGLSADEVERIVMATPGHRKRPSSNHVRRHSAGKPPIHASAGAKPTGPFEKELKV